MSLSEDASAFPGFDGPVAAELGTLNASGTPVPLGWDDPIQRKSSLERHRSVGDPQLHGRRSPIHIHEVQFQVVDQEPFDGRARPPEPYERGFKDTVIANPGEITRVKALFDLPGLYVGIATSSSTRTTR